MTYRTSNPPQSPASKAASHGAGTGTRGRPLTKLLTIEETAQILNVSPRTVRRAIDAGALPVHRIGRLIRVSQLDLAGFLGANRTV